MKITNVRVRVVEEGGADKLRGFATVTFDGEFVVRDLKIIDGNKGLFVAMPSRKMMERCPKCSHKNPVQSNFCNDCGNRLHTSHDLSDADARSRLHVDVAHPVTQDCREKVHEAVVREYEKERKSDRRNVEAY